jgi:hypothetical protein
MPPEQHPGHDRNYRGPLIVHARKHPGAISLCGQEPGWGDSTIYRSRVTCKLCLAEIERRLKELKAREQR